MVKFLIQRPIAVLMAFTACFIIGVVTYRALPVSLLPDIDIPQVTVQMTSENASAREMENTMMAPVRRALLQVSGLEEMRSETRDGSGVIRLSFEFGTNTDLAFIEVNEKIDAAMNSLPKDAERPKAIKASATDIPVFYLNMTLKKDVPYQATDEQAFLTMGELAENVVRRRIEQLPQVAMADMTGVPERMLQIVPDVGKMNSLGISTDELEQVLTANNVEPGSMLVRDGYYEYNIRIASFLRTPEDVENIYLNKEGRIMQLKDLCRVRMVTAGETGRSLAGGKRAVTFAIIKQSEENMDNLKAELKRTTDYFAAQYPDIDFSITRNQTELLDYTISNLQQNFTLGFLFIFIVAVFFIGDVRGGVGGDNVLLFLFVQGVAQYHLAFGADYGGGHDDRQCDYRDRKCVAIPGAGVYAEAGCRDRDERDDNAHAELIAHYGRRVCAFDIHERHCRSHFYRPGVLYHGRSGGVLLYRHYAAAGVVRLVLPVGDAEIPLVEFQFQG